MLAPQDDIAYLVMLAKAGSSEAFANLIQLYECELCGYLTSLLRDRDEAQDCAQQAFFKAWRKISTLKDESNFKPWLYIIARNVVRDSLRKTRKIVMQSWEELEEYSLIESSYQVEECVTQTELINLAFAKLPPKLRTCLRLAVCGCSRREIAQILGIGTDSVGTYLSMARKQFRQEYYCLEHDL
jgi:RNA polymerase sigma factor (sigma-70 family)